MYRVRDQLSDIMNARTPKYNKITPCMVHLRGDQPGIVMSARGRPDCGGS